LIRWIAKKRLEVSSIGVPEPSGEKIPLAELSKLDPRFIQNQAVGGLIALGILAGLGFPGLMVSVLFRGLDWVSYSLLGGAIFLAILLSIAAFIWPRLAYRHFRWRLDGVSLEIQEGVLWRHRVSVPLGRVQHADVSQGPLQRYFGLGKLKVFTAGTYQPFVEIDGLKHETAIELRDRLIKQTQRVA
jgi:uncharacterized protein